MKKLTIKLAPLLFTLGVLFFSTPVRAADGDVACFTVIDDDADQSGVWLRGGTSLHFNSASHYSKNADLSVYADNVVESCITSGWCSGLGGGGGSGDLEAYNDGPIVIFKLVGSSAYTHIQPNIVADGDDSLDFDPSDEDVYFAADTGQCGGEAAPAPDQSATNTAAAIELQTFVHGWAVIAGSTALALAFGWKLWKG